MEDATHVSAGRAQFELAGFSALIDKHEDPFVNAYIDAVSRGDRSCFVSRDITLLVFVI